MIPRLPRHGAVEVVVDAPPEAVWAVLADVTRIGEWSHECSRAEWLGGATAAAPGVRFRGANEAGRIRWARVCTLRVVDAPRELAWRTHGPRLLGDSTDWTVRLEPAGAATRIRQEFTVVSLPAPVDHLIATVLPAHRDRLPALRGDLERLGEVAATVASSC
ncbi:SRPBCC family protein [Actinomycetospora aeridis]|uniref:SRPBCC family protein n=1 Tax=Actinomycetospora aeridis TaxID=3129231 RepID=A0ABU8NBK9_9PSEU